MGVIGSNRKVCGGGSVVEAHEQHEHAEGANNDAETITRCHNVEEA